ncbi:MAG: matrixin family metalloprotease, partial [Planctomycetaceae bacterium]|nr:matrixin family metalloprotease [Planctomycetaceae bacterium]
MLSFLLPNRQSRRSRIGKRNRFAEVLESRTLLSASGGTNWHDPSALTVSFAPDGTNVLGRESQLFAQLDQLASRQEWQQVAFRALQAWAAPADINIGVVADGGQEFGIPGATQGDLRFGDIRIGSIPLASDVAALSISNNVAMSGTWIGDILINSNADFQSLDQFYAVMLHEVGHALGMEHSDDPSSPMYESPGAANAMQPTAGDIAILRRLNGNRLPDANESSRANDTLKRATRIRYSNTSSGYEGQTPLLSYGDVTTSNDVDYFFLPTLSGYAGSLTFSLRVGGFSLLSARMTVLDENGKVLGVASTNGEAGADTEITIQHRDRDSMYLVRVESDARAGDFAIGSYALVTTFDARNQVSPETLQEVLRLRYDFLREEESRPLLLGGQEPSFFDDLHLNDTLASATLLKSLSGFDEFQEYEATAGIADLNDVDFYQIKSPDFAAGDPGIMTVTVQAT